MLPLILHANSLVLERRARLLAAKKALEAGGSISLEELEQLRAGAVLLRIADAETVAKLEPARAAGRPLRSMELADGLVSYSERGQEYVDTLKGIIRVNGLDIADSAVFRDEPLRFSIGAEDETAAEALRRDIEAMRVSGELARIVARMRLE